VRGARQLITLQGPEGPRRGAALNRLGIIHDGALLVQDGKILELGPSRRLENVIAARGAREINAAGRVVMPGFVDSRMQPLIAELTPGAPDAGAPNPPRRPLAELQALPSGRLQARAERVLARMARHGTTTVSAGVLLGLGRPAALKMLRILANADDRPLSLIPTLHFAPPAEAQFNTESEIVSLCNQWLPSIAHRNLARFVEVNGGGAEMPVAQRFLERAENLGLGLRIRAGASTPALRLALERDTAGVILDDIAATEVEALAESPATVLLAPTARRSASHLLARALIDGGAAVALTSGFGFEHASTYNMQMVIALACSEMGMSAAEAIGAATINGACALGLGDRCGSLQPGRRADLIMLNVEDYRDIAYQFGVNHVHLVVKDGAIVYQEGEVAGCSDR